MAPIVDMTLRMWCLSYEQDSLFSLGLKLVFGLENVVQQSSGKFEKVKT